MVRILGTNMVAMIGTDASEHDHQATLIQLIDNIESRAYPELKLLFAVPNAGARTKYEGGRLKAEGMRSGVPDLMLPVARGGYHGLFIEMKRMGGQPTPEQRKWLAALNHQGYYCVVCQGCDAAHAVLLSYINSHLVKQDRLHG
jgi:hypothetical protein